MNNLKIGKTLTPSRPDEDVSNVQMFFVTFLGQYYKCKFNNRMIVKNVNIYIYNIIKVE